MTISHNTEEKRRLRSQKKAERMRMMIFTGSEAIVKRNRARAGPYAVKAQPKNESAVMLNRVDWSDSTEHFWKLSSNVRKIYKSTKILQEINRTIFSNAIVNTFIIKLAVRSIMFYHFNLLFYTIVDCSRGSMVKAKYIGLVIT